MTTKVVSDTNTDQIAAAFQKVRGFAFPSLDSSQIQARIQKEAEAEAGSAKPLLLSESGMTNGMRAACVEPVLDMLGDFEKAVSDFENAIKPRLSEIEALDNLDREIADLERQSKETEERIEAKYRANAKYAQVAQEMEHTKALYEERYREHGQRKAKDFPLWAYIPILIAIGCVEWLVNYEAFLENFGAPAMAAGFTIIVALVVAAASHEHGTLLKQREHFFGEAVEQKHRTWKLIWVGFVTLGLLAAFGFVGWNRYNWAVDVMLQLGGNKIVIGGGAGLPQIDIGQKVTMSIIANVLVWLLGATIAYWVHDVDPEFTDRWRRAKKANKVYLKWRKRIDGEIRTARAQLAKDIEAKKNTSKALSQKTRALSDMRAQVRARCESIVAEAENLVNRMIRAYRTALTDIARASNPELAFNKGGAIIDIERYRQIEIAYSITASRAAA